jgi:hypothetical protein
LCISNSLLFDTFITIHFITLYKNTLSNFDTFARIGGEMLMHIDDFQLNLWRSPAWKPGGA